MKMNYDAERERTEQMKEFFKEEEGQEPAPAKILILDGCLKASVRRQGAILADGWYNIYPVKPLTHV